jgi:phosphoribosyl-ATP pyrophosphohydrolase
MTTLRGLDPGLRRDDKCEESRKIRRFREKPPALAFSILPAMKFEEIVELVRKRKAEMPEGRSTTELFRKGADGIGKKLVEEAAESWMAARFEDREAQALELSQVLYYVACMMAEKGLTLEEIEARL